MPGKPPENLSNESSRAEQVGQILALSITIRIDLAQLHVKLDALMKHLNITDPTQRTR